MPTRTVATLVFVLSLCLTACGGESGPDSLDGGFPTAELDPSFVGSTVPQAIPQPGAFGAPDSLSDLQRAALFAWQEFIALNWPADPAVRDTPDTTRSFGDRTFAGPLVWHTYRGKVETYPGTGFPPGYVADAGQDFGYDTPPSQYVYDAAKVGSGYTYPGGPLLAGEVPPQNDADINLPTAWINLDETSQLGLCTLFASGLSDTVEDPQSQLLYLAKSNREEYTYVVDPANSYFNHQGNFAAAKQNWIDSYTTAGITDTPPAGPIISFPNGTIEAKGSFRRLAPDEDPSRFYTTTVRYYVPQEAGRTYGGQAGVEANPCWVQETLALVGFHIIHKIAESPTFVYATFEHTDNIRGPGGRAVEDANGNLSWFASLQDPTTPHLAFSDDPVNPTVTALGPYHNDPFPRLYYQDAAEFVNLPTGGPICVNRRFHDIPQSIIDINQLVHQTIAEYASSEGIGGTVWQNYKLVNVQAHPLDQDDDDIANADPETRAVYFLANSTIETNYGLGNFHGRQDGGGAPSSDVPPGEFNPPYRTDSNFQNIFQYDDASSRFESWNMGGCMGCHGNAQRSGTDFSFLLDDGPVDTPEILGAD